MTASAGKLFKTNSVIVGDHTFKLFVTQPGDLLKRGPHF